MRLKIPLDINRLDLINKTHVMWFESYRIHMEKIFLYPSIYSKCYSEAALYSILENVFYFKHKGFQNMIFIFLKINRI